MQFVSEPYIAFANGKKMLAICSTVFDDGNKVSGVVGSTVELEVLDVQIQRNLSTLTENYGQKAQFMLVAHESQLVLHYAWDEEAAKYSDSLHKQLVLFGTDMLPDSVSHAMKTLAGDGGNFLYFNDGGQKTFLARSPISDSNYSIYLLVPTAQLFYADGIVSGIVCVMGIVMFLTLTISAFVVLKNDVVKPVTKTSKALGDISAGDGDLTMRLDQSRKDEIGDLGGKFNAFVGNIHSIVSSIKSEAVKLEKVSVDLEAKVFDIDGDIKNISQNVTNLNTQADEQSASAVETASTVEQISRNITKLTDNIDNQSHAVSDSSSAIHQMVENINSIAENLEKASKRFDDLQEASTTGKTNISAVQALVTSVSEQSEKLLDTNKMINAIANQTNLLAMNAAIEAAHAGEAGRGFSVVAEEIRKLAEDASKQSKTIAVELKNIVSKIADIVNATAKAGVSFDTVVNQVEASSQIVEQITSSLKEQAVGNDHVLKSLEEIHDSTVEVRGSAQEMGQGAMTILREMTRLKDIAQQVQNNARGISEAVSTIEVSVSHIKTNSEQNTSSVETLNDLSGKFKL